MTYKLYKNLDGTVNSVIKIISKTTFDDGTFKSHEAHIPFDPANSDYREYLEWLAQGNTAEAAD